MEKLYVYDYDRSRIVTESFEEAEEFGITSIIYGTKTDLEPSWTDEYLICVEDVVCSNSGNNYFVEKIIAG